MESILTVVHVFLSAGLIGLILIQHGKGADAGAAFGSGASATVFGARGAANFLSRTTAILAILFFITSFVLAWFALNAGRQEGLMTPVVEQQQTAPAVERGKPVESDLPPVAQPDAAVVNSTAAEDLPQVEQRPAADAVPAVDAGQQPVGEPVK